MRQYIRKVGRVKIVGIFSALSIIVGMIATLLVTSILNSFGMDLDLRVSMGISIFITLCLAPATSWFMIGLYLKIDRLEEEMRQLATYDSLTGLLTRREFFERVSYYHKLALREDLPYSLIITDLDDFKEINDQLGHLTGDQTLKTFGEAILENMRDSDLACRFGGDEFLFFLPNSTHDQAEQFGHRLHEVIAEAIDRTGLDFDLSVSLGIATYPDIPAVEVEDLIAAADKAMYQYKRSKGNNGRYHNTEIIS